MFLEDYKNTLKTEIDTLKQLLRLLEHERIEELFDTQPEVVVSLILSRNVNGLMQYLDLKDTHTIQQLRKLARAAKIPYYTQYSKDELIALLKKENLHGL